MGDDVRAGARAYRDIKQAILSGEFRLRQRLDIEELARRFRVSATPVRRALAILSAERLVSAGGARGYRVAFWSERELGELYQWRGQLAGLAAETHAARESGKDNWRGLPHEDGFAALMDDLDSDAHGELKRAARAANERLRAAVRAEPAALTDADADLAVLAAAMRAGDAQLLRQEIEHYFSRRIDQAGAIRAAAHARAIPNNGE